jgi:uncharacterized membrane protein
MNTSTKTLGMTLVLLVAGLLHFITPDVFIKAVPPYLLAPKFIVYLTGVMEILLALGLIRESSRSNTAQLLMIYFVILLPAHIYVSLEGIEMFGVSHKGLLWARTLGQGLFIYWAYLIKKESKLN